MKADLGQLGPPGIGGGLMMMVWLAEVKVSAADRAQTRAIFPA